MKIVATLTADVADACRVKFVNVSAKGADAADSEHERRCEVVVATPCKSGCNHGAAADAVHGPLFLFLYPVVATLRIPGIMWELRRLTGSVSLPAA